MVINLLANKIKTLLQPVPTAYKNEFMAELTAMNHSRIHIAIWVMVGYATFILISDFALKKLWIISNWTLFVKMDILFASTTLIYLVFFKFLRAKPIFDSVRKALLYLLPFFLVVWSAIIAGTEYMYSQGFPTYIIVLLLVCTAFYFKMGLSIIYILISLVVLLANVHYTYEVNETIMARYFTLIPIVVLSLVVSRVLFLARLNDFLNRKKIEEMNRELTSNNEHLELRVKEKTSELLRTSEQYKEAKERAEASDRLKTAFLRNMSHEFRTPLHTIIGFASLLDEYYPNDPEEEKYIRFIIHKGDDLLNMVENILQFSELESGKTATENEMVNLNQMMHHLKSNYNEPAHDKDIALNCTCDLPQKKADVYTDKEKVERVIKNLINNALKYTHYGSVEFGYKITENEIAFFVKDTGIGIEPAYHKKIFERFWHFNQHQTEHYPGIGLGLAVCKAYAHLLNGKIGLESHPGKGSTFFFTIPYDTNLPQNES